MNFNTRSRSKIIIILRFVGVGKCLRESTDAGEIKFRLHLRTPSANVEYYHRIAFRRLSRILRILTLVKKKRLQTLAPVINSRYPPNTHAICILFELKFICFGQHAIYLPSFDSIYVTALNGDTFRANKKNVFSKNLLPVKHEK